jgi:hypothetical protein
MFARVDNMSSGTVQHLKFALKNTPKASRALSDSFMASNN